jgi:hypothetical protein
MRRIETAEFKSGHIPEAASLFCSQFEEQREVAPDLPDEYAESESITPLISSLSDKTSGIAAFSDSRLVGYLTAWASRNSRAHTSVSTAPNGHMEQHRKAGRRSANECMKRSQKDGYQTNATCIA